MTGTGDNSTETASPGTVDGRGDPVGWIDKVRLEGSDDYVRVAFFERSGSDLLVRQIDPNEPEPPRISS